MVPVIMNHRVDVRRYYFNGLWSYLKWKLKYVISFSTWYLLPNHNQSPAGFRQQLKTVMFMTSFSEDTYA